MASAATGLHLYDPRRAVGRILLSSMVAVLAAYALQLSFAWPVALLGGWNAGGLVLAALSWMRIATFDQRRTAERAAADDPGRTAVYSLVLLTSTVSLLAAVLLVRQRQVLPQSDVGPMLALCFSTVALAWTVTHTAFTLRYAHLYYREDEEGVGGIEFPGREQPCYGDFAYLAFTIGMCFQVSDTAITGRQIRGTVLRHAVLSFAYNTAILAFVLNLIFGRAS
jgi:uncharacterized membrane protein